MIRRIVCRIAKTHTRQQRNRLSALLSRVVRSRSGRRAGHRARHSQITIAPRIETIARADQMEQPHARQ